MSDDIAVQKFGFQPSTSCQCASTGYVLLQITELQVCIATGKARGPWCKKVLPKLGAAMPGVYMQGLLIYNADGSIMHEESLSQDLVRETIKLAKELGAWLHLQATILPQPHTL